MGFARITSKNNPIVQTMRLVAAQSRRAPEGLVLAEGLRVLEEALSSCFAIEAIIVREGFGECPREYALLAECSRRGARIYEAPTGLLKALSDVCAPQGALALVRVPNRTLASLTLGPDPLVLCACGIQDPGNLGTLLRAARATGVFMACTTSGTVSARNPKTVRSSAGASFHLPVVEGMPAHGLRDYFVKEGIQTYRTSAGEGVPCWDVDLRGACAILLGNESWGVERGTWDESPCMRIPMAPGAESLNVAAAGAIVMYEAMRQRLASTTGRL